MKAAVCDRYGPPSVVRILDVERPVPGAGEVLIKVAAASLNALDGHVVSGTPRLARIMIGLRRPKSDRLGCDVAGRVEAVGANVTRFKAGAEVFGSCRGAFAEYACVAEGRLARKPAPVTFEAAAAVPVAGITALQGLRDRGRIQRGQSVAIDGASGGVGTFAVQIAKAFGAEVTAVCSPANMDQSRSLGADHVIDYTREDFTKRGPRYDLILGANVHHSILKYRRALRPGGVFAMVGGGGIEILQAMLLGPFLSRMGSRRMRIVRARIDAADLAFLAELLAAGSVVPAIDRRYPLGEIVDALRYLGEGHARGKVVLTMEGEPTTG